MAAASFMRAMLAPYIDLSRPCASAPVHTWRPYWSWQKCVSEEPAREPNLQRVLPPAFRESLQAELGRPLQLAVRHPAELDPLARSDDWRELIALVDNFARLAEPKRATVLATLMSLGFFELVTELSPMPAAEDVRARDSATAIAGTVAASRLILGLEGLRPYTLDDHIVVARNARPGSQARFDAALNLVVQCGKWLKDPAQTRYWREVAQKELDEQVALHGSDSFTANLLTSRFYRGVSYLPFLENDRVAVVREMELCERCAHDMTPGSAREELLKRENMIPMLQSRAKEARWLGDLALAKARLQEACEIDPVDAVRWIELGEVLLDCGDFAQAANCYVRGASFAPPGASLAWFMAGECERLQDNLELACAY